MTRRLAQDVPRVAGEIFWPPRRSMEMESVISVTFYTNRGDFCRTLEYQTTFSATGNLAAFGAVAVVAVRLERPSVHRVEDDAENPLGTEHLDGLSKRRILRAAGANHQQ